MSTDNCFGIKQPLSPIMQADLSSGKRKMTTWLDVHPKLRQGSLITLKHIDGLWKVIKLYPQVHSALDFDWHRQWDNNI